MLLLEVNIDSGEGGKGLWRCDKCENKVRVSGGERERVLYLETVTVRDNDELCLTLTFYLYKDYIKIYYCLERMLLENGPGPSGHGHQHY